MIVTANVFTYGSLMYEKVWRQVVGEFSGEPAPALLHGYRRSRIRRENFPAMVADEQSFIPGALYSGVSEEQLALLDEFEGIEYERIDVAVALSASITLNAHAYLYLEQSKLDPRPWDPDDFEQNQIDIFLKDNYPPR